MFRKFLLNSSALNFSKLENRLSLGSNKQIRFLSSSSNPNEKDDLHEHDQEESTDNKTANPQQKRKEIAGSDYFRFIAKNQNSHVRTIDDLILNNASDHSQIKLDKVSNNNQKNASSQQHSNDPKLFAQQFLKKQEWYKTYMLKKQKQSTENQNKIGQKKFVNQELMQQEEEIDEADSTTSQPRDWRQEIISHKRKSTLQDSSKFTEKYNNKYAQSDRQLRNKKYNEFKSKQQQFTEKQGKLDSESHHEMKEIYERQLNQILPVENNNNQLELLVNCSELSKYDEEEKDESKLTEEERLERQIRALRPATRPVVYNLAYFVNQNLLLQKFVEMGVVIREWDKDTSIGSFMLKLDFDKHVKPVLIFLHDIGIPAKEHPHIITKNPMIFKESIDNLNVRVEYLKSKKFTLESIVEILVKAPKWLSLSVEQVDQKLGWFQKEFKLNGQEVRDIVTSRPKLVTLPLKVASDVRFILKDFLTFDDAKLKLFIKQYPKMFTKNFKTIESNFIFLTQVMKLKHEEISTCPQILVASLLELKSRYSFLKHLDRLQFDPTKPNFISLKSLIDSDDESFCKRVSKTTLDEYKRFLKTV
jgi:mTERF domain-containing protein